jgi:recombinational DNA repair protein (RecF pathway)
MMTHSTDRCADCGESPGSLYQRAKDRKFVCFTCLDRTAPKQVDAYPGWRERERQKRRQSDQARKNFSHRVTETQSRLFA